MQNELNTRLGSNAEAQDLSACDKEPLRHIGSIQSRGLLTVFDPDTQRVTNVSADSGMFFHRDTESLPGLHIRELFTVGEYELILEQLNSVPFRTDGHRHFTLNDRSAYVYRVDSLIGLEIEFERAGETELAVNRLDLITSAIGSIKMEPDLVAAGRAFCRAVRDISGMDRVMIYRFHQPTWHGEVIAEDKVAEAHSFMSHFFPASDIPRHARDLYLRNRLRFINDVDEPVAPITPPTHPRTHEPLDLSDSRLRGVSPIHLEYLRNMGVRSSLSLAIVVEDKLWGLLACHGLEPKSISARARAECEVLANAYAVRVRWEETNAKNEQRLVLERRFRDIVLQLARGDSPEEDLLRHHQALQTVLRAGGVALVVGQHVDLAGLTPTRDDVLKLSQHLFKRMHDVNTDVLPIRNLTEIDPTFEAYRTDASGVLALGLPDLHDAVLLIFRPEVVRFVRWGGDPRKQLGRRGYGGRINPRLSFDSWTETIRNECPEWLDYEVDAAAGFRDLVFLGLARHARLLREMTQVRRGSNVE